MLPALSIAKNVYLLSPFKFGHAENFLTIVDI